MPECILTAKRMEINRLQHVQRQQSSLLIIVYKKQCVSHKQHSPNQQWWRPRNQCFCKCFEMSKLAPWVIICSFIIDKAKERERKRQSEGERERERLWLPLDHKIKPQGNSESLHDCSLPAWVKDRPRERDGVGKDIYF